MFRPEYHTHDGGGWYVDRSSLVSGDPGHPATSFCCAGAMGYSEDAANDAVVAHSDVNSGGLLAYDASSGCSAAVPNQFETGSNPCEGGWWRPDPGTTEDSP